MQVNLSGETHRAEEVLKLLVDLDDKTLQTVKPSKSRDSLLKYDESLYFLQNRLTYSGL